MAAADRDKRAERRAARALWELLTRPGAYRRRWEFVARSRGLRIVRGAVHQEAVREVLVDWLEDQGEITPRQADDWAKRPWKDRVSRTASGALLSEDTLRVFIEAFAITPAEAEQLWRIRSGEQQGPLLRGLRPYSGLPVPPRQYETIALDELHVVGADRLPERHETRQGVRALVDGFQAYPYRFDTDEIEGVQVLRGGTASTIKHVDGPIYEVTITLDEPLKAGQEKYLTYVTRFRYLAAPYPDLRRSLPESVETAGIQVLFAASCLPQRVWWVVWDDWKDGSNVLGEEEMPLAPDNSVYRVALRMGGAVVGFRWQW